jgi:hypothetical protein
MSGEKDRLPSKSSGNNGVARFLKDLARMPAPRGTGRRGRLIFAMDATASRGPTWDRACHIQGEMFKATASLGGLDVKLVFFRGFGECKASPWVSSADALVKRMTAVACLGGLTQIGRVFNHALKETKTRKVNALVLVGDSMEEDIDKLCHQAGELGLLGVPVFAFHEGRDPVAMAAFQQFARLSGGAYCPFDSASAEQLRELLAAVAVYAAGGLRALEDYGKQGGKAVAQITAQIKS